MIPTAKALERIDAAKQDLQPTNEDSQSFFDLYYTTHRDRLAFDIEYVLENAAKRDSILDVGCSPLLAFRALQREGFQITGVDLRPDEFADAIDKWQMQVACCDIEREPLPFADESFDLVQLNEVFEHLRINLPFTLRQLFRVLRPGGRLLLSTPNLRSFRGLINFLFRDRGISDAWDIYSQFEKLQQHGHMGHIREYTFTEVNELLERIGWQTVERISRGHYQRTATNVLVSMMPRLRPFMSIVAVKPG